MKKTSGGWKERFLDFLLKVQQVETTQIWKCRPSAPSSPIWCGNMLVNSGKTCFHEAFGSSALIWKGLWGSFSNDGLSINHLMPWFCSGLAVWSSRGGKVSSFFCWLYFRALRDGNVFNQSQAKVGIHRSFDKRWLLKGNQRADVNILVVDSTAHFSRERSAAPLFGPGWTTVLFIFFFPNSDFQYQRKRRRSHQSSKIN